MAISTLTSPLSHSTTATRSVADRILDWMKAYGRHRALRWLEQQPDDFLEAHGLDRKTMEENIRSA